MKPHLVSKTLGHEEKADAGKPPLLGHILRKTQEMPDLEGDMRSPRGIAQISLACKARRSPSCRKARGDRFSFPDEKPHRTADLLTVNVSGPEKATKALKINAFLRVGTLAGINHRGSRQHFWGRGAGS